MSAFDYFISTTFLSFVGRWPLVDSIAVFFAQYTGYALLIVLLIALIRKRSWRIVALEALIASFISRILLVEVIRSFLHRTRPFAELSFSPLVQKLTEVSSSFPSGHAAFYFAIATVVFLRSKIWGSVFLGVAVLMGIARVYGGVHWASDILGGAALGVASGLFTVWLFRWARAHM